MTKEIEQAIDKIVNEDREDYLDFDLGEPKREPPPWTFSDVAGEPDEGHSDVRMWADEGVVEFPGTEPNTWYSIFVNPYADTVELIGTGGKVEKDLGKESVMPIIAKWLSSLDLDKLVSDKVSAVLYRFTREGYFNSDLV